MKPHLQQVHIPPDIIHAHAEKTGSVFKVKAETFSLLKPHGLPDVWTEGIPSTLPCMEDGSALRSEGLSGHRVYPQETRGS